MGEGILHWISWQIYQCSESMGGIFPFCRSWQQIVKCSCGKVQPSPPTPPLFLTKFILCISTDLSVFSAINNPWSGHLSELVETPEQQGISETFHRVYKH